MTTTPKDILRAYAEGRIDHAWTEFCPDRANGRDSRDPNCPVCAALDADAAVAKPSGNRYCAAGMCLETDGVHDACCQRNATQAAPNAALYDPREVAFTAHTAPQQDEQEPVDGMGMPLSCSMPLCAPGDHHPLCKLAPPPAPQPAVQQGNLRERCAEILAWRKTGVLSGSALRSFAGDRYGDAHDALQMAERDTETEALRVLAAHTSSPVAQGDEEEPRASTT